MLSLEFLWNEQSVPHKCREGREERQLALADLSPLLYLDESIRYDPRKAMA
jgi:hypothetical protein